MTPHKCPVCDGAGTIATTDCHACIGTGIVWEPCCTPGTTVLPGGVIVRYHQCPHENKSDQNVS